MATLTINGQRVKVDDSFLSLPPDQQNATVDEIARSLRPADQPPAGAVPGSREYADWAATRARAQMSVPSVSPKPPEWGTSPFDQIQAGYTSAVNAIPIAGPTLLNAVESAKAGIWNVPQEQLATQDRALEGQNPTASTVGTVAGTVLPFMAGGAIPVVGRALGMTGNLASRMIMGGTSGALISAADTKARGGSDEDAKNSLLLGGGIGAAFPLVARGMGAAVRRVVSPNLSNATQEAAAQTMRREGVTLTAGQRTGSKALKYAESVLGGGTAERMQETQARQFTRAVLQRAGIAADEASPDVIDGAFTRIGNEMDGLAARNTLHSDQQFVGDLTSAWQDYSSTVPASHRAPVIENTLRDIANTINKNGGTLAGDAYQSFRSRLERLARKTLDPELMAALRDIRTALDDAMERSIGATNPGDLGAWQEVRNQYRNMLVIEKAATGAGEQAASGIITPARLRSAAIQQNRRAFARGRNDFTELANAGAQTMTPLPQSGTEPRQWARSLAAAPAVIGGSLGAPAGIPGMIAGAVAGAGVPWAMGRGMLSRPGRAYLGNQLALNFPTLQRALMAPALPSLAGTRRQPVEITVGR